MAEDDNWRRRRADELFGNATGATLPAGNAPRSLYRGTREQAAPRPTPTMIPIGPERDARAIGHADVPRATAAPRTPVVTRSGGVSASVALRGLAVVVALFVAAAIGWLVRGDATPQSVAGDSRIAPSPTQPMAAPLEQSPAPTTPVAPAVVAPVVTVEPVAAPDIVMIAKPKSAPKSPPRSERIAKPVKAMPAAKAKKAEVSAVAAKPRTARADRPSFDCRRNRGAVAQLICNDPVLVTLDRRLASRFAALDASSDTPTVLRLHQGETRFLNARQTCTTAACIERSYRQRLHELAREN